MPAAAAPPALAPLHRQAGVFVEGWIYAAHDSEPLTLSGSSDECYPCDLLPEFDDRVDGILLIMDGAGVDTFAAALIDAVKSGSW
jgi:hypothetical protein